MPTESTKHHSSSPAWHWYLIGAASAVIMGVSSFVVSYNYMVGHVPILFAISCALSGLALNTLLYWQDSAKKLQRFSTLLTTQLDDLFSLDALLCLGSALCAGFLAFQSYQEQMAMLPATLIAVIPIYSLTVLFSAANSISTFVLFYNPSEGESGKNQQISLFAWIKSRMRILFGKPLLVHCAYALGTFQSVLFTLTNSYCVRQVLSLCFPFAPIANTVVAGILATALVMSEVGFNCLSMERFAVHGISNAPQSIDMRWRDLLMSMAAMNAFANGYIALGALQHLSVVARWSIVSVGSIVSFAVMQEPITSIYQLISDFKSQRARFIPERDSLFKMVEGASKIMGCLGGLYLFEPVVLTTAISAYPLMIGVVSGVFSGTLFLCLGGDSLVDSLIHGVFWPGTNGSKIHFPNVPESRSAAAASSLINISRERSLSTESDPNDPDHYTENLGSHVTQRS
ncbi:MAG: hypothetical protein CMF43_03525 [Legionellales bacterium]|nr:hypothetical protein [Legionellales bacterium]